MKNTLSITSNCVCSCVDSVADGTNSIYVSLDVGNVINPQLKVWLNDELKSTVELIVNEINYVNLPPELFTANGVIKFQYLDDTYTGKIFSISFPETLDGNLSIQKNGDYVFNAKYTKAGAVTITVDSELSTTSENPVQNKVIMAALNGKSNTGHTHDDRYYTEAETNNLLNGKANSSHTHDDRYYTESEVNRLLSNKQDASNAITTSNIGSQSVNYATRAGSAQPIFNNNTLYSIGDDVKIGDQNIRGTLIVQGSNGEGNILLRNASGGNVGYVINSNADNSAIGVKLINKYSDSANLAVYIRNGSAYNISLWSSDKRLKENIIENDEPVLELINQIKTYSFDFKNREHGAHVNVGILAQELKELIPEAVMSVPQGKGAEYEELLQIDGNKIIPYLIKAIQEQQTEIKELKVQVDTLNGNSK